jgi:hypothetical protein
VLDIRLCHYIYIIFFNFFFFSISNIWNKGHNSTKGATVTFHFQNSIVLGSKCLGHEYFLVINLYLVGVQKFIAPR